MKLPIVKTVNGKWSNTNVVLILLFLVDLVDIIYPFIPGGLQVYKVPFIAIVMLIIRTFFSSGDPIQTKLL